MVSSDDDLPPSHNAPPPSHNLPPPSHSVSSQSHNLPPPSHSIPPPSHNLPPPANSVPPQRQRVTNMEAHIRQIEKEAHFSVLRAFRAQADELPWAKEMLLADLRIHLGISDEEHKELLARVNTDDTIRRRWEPRQSRRMHPSTPNAAQVVHDTLASHNVSDSTKTHQPNQPISSQSFAGTSFSLHPQAGPSLSSSTAKRGFVAIAPRVENKRPKLILPPEDTQCIGGDPGINRTTRPNSDPQQGTSLAKNTLREEAKAITSQLRNTKELIREIKERLQHNPVPEEVERAKRVLEEHDMDLMEAIAKLKDLDDSKDEP